MPEAGPICLSASGPWGAAISPIPLQLSLMLFLLSGKTGVEVEPGPRSLWRQTTGPTLTQEASARVPISHMGADAVLEVGGSDSGCTRVVICNAGQPS